MKKFALVLSTIALINAVAPAALAAPRCTLTGALNGMTVRVGLDLDGDGRNARSGVLQARSTAFAAVSVVVDTAVAPIQDCPVPLTKIIPSGHAVFASPSGRDVVFTTIDPSKPLCVGIGVVTEDVSLIVTGGRGLYAGARGTGTARFTDDTSLEYDAAGAPTVVYTYEGSFKLNLQ